MTCDDEYQHDQSRDGLFSKPETPDTLDGPTKRIWSLTGRAFVKVTTISTHGAIGYKIQIGMMPPKIHYDTYYATKTIFRILYSRDPYQDNKLDQKEIERIESEL